MSRFKVDLLNPLIVNMVEVKPEILESDIVKEIIAEQLYTVQFNAVHSIDNEELIWSLVQAPNGVVLNTVNNDMSVLEWIPSEEVVGEHEFCVRVTDTYGAYDEKLWVLAVLEIPNIPPVTSSDTYTVKENTSLVVDVPGVLFNDVDVDADLLTTSLVSGPTSGILELSSNGSFVYTPNVDFYGIDTFVYKAFDGKDWSNESTVTITVEEVPDIPSDIPELDTYVKRMNQYGKYHGDRFLSGYYVPLNDSALAAAYYDGMFVYQNIAKYTGNEEYWLSIEAAIIPTWRDWYVLRNNGGVPGYWNFTHGTTEHYLRTGDTESQRATILCSKNAAYARDSTPTTSTVSFSRSREVAYAIESYINAERCGEARRDRLSLLVEHALGHLDQWFVDQADDVFGPFMFGLTAEALIMYWEYVNQDPIILEKLQLGADWCWNNAWVAADESFYYRKDNPNSGAPDLNQLISPLWGWLYAQTNDVKYRVQGDQIFAGGVKDAYLAGSKQFNQNYRWGFKYIDYRNGV